jgi:Protein of unknown function (DUF3147)
VVEFEVSDIKDTKPLELLLRFLFGGICTVAAGLIAKWYGPLIGGLFLAFPAIFPAGVTLIQSHEIEKKTKVGSDGTHRGRIAASIDSAGAALGCCGLVAFAVICWRWLPIDNPTTIIVIAASAWLAVSMILWELRRRRWSGRRRV